MTDILIRGMDKPHNCFQCDLSHLRGERLFCHVTKDEVLRSKIASDCPIHELPEHGDLIDRDEIKTNMIDEVLGKTMSYVNMEQIKNAPVVIPASKEETE